MNFSEYMALLSGNTDLLDKAKLEKRIASLEGERKSFNKGKRDSEFKLESKTGELRNNTAFIDAMTEDWNRFLSVVQTDKEGNRLNIIKVDGVNPANKPSHMTSALRTPFFIEQWRAKRLAGPGV